MANATITLISSQTLGGSTASVTFSSIPSTYNDLKLVFSANTASATSIANLFFTLNGDSTANYSTTRLSASSGTAASDRYTSSSQANIGVYSGTSSGYSASIFTYSELYIPSYTSTTAKQMFSSNTAEVNAAPGAYLATLATLYRGTSAITSISFTPSFAFATNSSFYLYGIKNS